MLKLIVGGIFFFIICLIILMYIVVGLIYCLDFTRRGKNTFLYILNVFFSFMIRFILVTAFLGIMVFLASYVIESSILFVNFITK